MAKEEERGMKRIFARCIERRKDNQRCRKLVSNAPRWMKAPRPAAAPKGDLPSPG